MKIYTLLIGLLISSSVFSAKIPMAWIADTLEDPSFDKSTEMLELEKQYDNILDAKSQMVEKITSKKRKNRKWFLEAIKSEIEVENSGSLGIGALNGGTGVEFIWHRTKESKKKLQQKYYGVSNEPTIEKSNDDDSVGQDTVRFTSNTSTLELSREIEPLVEASFKSGKIKNKKLFKTNLLAKINEYQKLLSDLDEMPDKGLWIFHKMGFDLHVDASGRVLPFLTVGTSIRLKLQWYRIIKKNSDKAVKKISDNSKFIMAMAQDFKMLDSLTIGKKNKKTFTLGHIKIGVGIGASGNLGVARLKFHAIGFAFFKRIEKNKNDKSTELHLGDTFPIIDYYSDENLAYAKKHAIKVEPNISSDKSRIGDRIRSGIFNASRENFRKGLNKAVKMAKFWSRVPLRRQARRIARGKEQNFDMTEIELKLQIFLRGTVGLATVEGLGVLELEFEKE